MGRKKLRRELAVAMNGFVVGTWTRSARGEHSFRYAGEWLARDGAIPVSLSMPLSGDVFSGHRALRSVATVDAPAQQAVTASRRRSASSARAPARVRVPG